MDTLARALAAVVCADTGETPAADELEEHRFVRSTRLHRQADASVSVDQIDAPEDRPKRRLAVVDPDARTQAKPAVFDRQRDPWFQEQHTVARRADRAYSAKDREAVEKSSVTEVQGISVIASRL